MLFKGPCSLHSRPAHALMSLLLVGLFVQTLRVATDHRKSPLLQDAEMMPEGNASPEELYLERLSFELGLSHKVSWVAWRIQPSEQSEAWPSVTEVHLNFGAITPKTIALENPDRMDLYAKKRMELPVPTGPKLGDVDASDFLFGISTTYARISDRDYAMVKAWARWLTDGHHHSNGASMVVVLDQASAGQLDEVDQALQASGLDCWVTTTEEPMSMARRYFELTRILKKFASNLAANGQNKRWFGLVEDDVFFPSLSYLRDRLFMYNTDMQQYIGMPSEKLDWDTSDSEQMQTHGGGAVLLTLSALTRIPNLPCFQTEPSKKTSFRSKRWDELLHTCLVRHTELDMHVLPGFYSPNDKSLDHGVDSYETGQQPLLLRRYGQRHLLNINRAHLVANVCGESCFMQRYLFRDNWVLVNGISITQYPDGVTVAHRDAHKDAPSKDAPSKDAPKTDKSKRADNETSEAEPSAATSPLAKRIHIDEDTGALESRATLTWSGRRNVWKLVDSAVSKDGAVWQAYLKRGKRRAAGQSEGGDEDDSLIILVWELPKRVF